MLAMLTIFKMQTQEFNHESPFYHIGWGTNGGAAVLPPRGFSMESAKKRCPKKHAMFHRFLLEF